MSFFKVIPRQVQLVIPDKEKQGVINTITKIRRLFGPNGKYWVKNTYKTTKDGFDAFCLVGAEREANGQFEPAARAAIALAIDQYKPISSLSPTTPEYILDEATINFNDASSTTWEDISQILRNARKLVRQAATK